MRIVLAPDSFKESLTALQAVEAMAAGVSRVLPDADLVRVPMADGGEGTVQSLVDATGGRLVARRVRGPLGEPVDARFGILGDGVTAAIEMAEASGLQLVAPEQRDPMVTTTYGTGELLRAALDEGARRIIIGIGGSATVDGGAGLAAALGYRLLRQDGTPIAPGGGGLDELDRIDAAEADPRLQDADIRIASDVENPLTGPTGSAAVFGPQKGATPAMVAVLDENLDRFSQIVARDLGRDVRDVPGAGAAGGLGAGLLAFTRAAMHRGFDLVADLTGLADACRGADVVLTGEGRVDAQTQYGKTPLGVARLAKQVSPRAVVIALAGQVGPGADALYGLGIDAIFGVLPGASDLAAALRDGAENLERCSENVARLLLRARRA